MSHSQASDLDVTSAGSSDGGSDMFVAWVPEDSKPKGIKGLPRLSHKKSKSGCQRCRARRVKCDEIHPVCGGCQRHRVLCLYDLPVPGDTLSPDVPRRSSLSAESSKAIGSVLVESRERRLLDVRLMHHWTISTADTFPLSAIAEMRDINTTVIPRLALTNDALLYAIFFLTALHLSKTEAYSSEIAETYHHYLDLSIRNHRNDITQLCSQTADIVCTTSSLIRFGTIAILEHRPIEPYTPPIQWMYMGRGCTDVYRTAWSWIGDKATSIAARAVKRGPDLSNPAVLFADSNREPLLHLLTRSPRQQEEEPWDAETAEAYEHMLNYIGGVFLAVAANIEPQADILKRLVGFSGAIEKKKAFDLIEEARPRALVILAHYFAILAQFSDTWWIGTAGIRELNAIAGVLDDDWSEMMDWPLKILRGLGL